MMRSRSRWNGVRVGLEGSGCSRPRLAAGSDANAARPAPPKPIRPPNSPCTPPPPVHPVHDTADRVLNYREGPANSRPATEHPHDDRNARHHAFRPRRQAYRPHPVQGSGRHRAPDQCLRRRLFRLPIWLRPRRARNPDDLVIEKSGATVLIDQVSIPFMEGSEIDFADDLIGQSFQIKNPLATSSCGCGTSFAI